MTDVFWNDINPPLWTASLNCTKQGWIVNVNVFIAAVANDEIQFTHLKTHGH